MNHFTQLNLQGNSGSKSSSYSGPQGGTGGKTPTPGKPPKKQHGIATMVAIAGSLAAAGLVAALTLGTNGCSKSNKPDIAGPAPMASLPQPVPAPLTASATAPAAATKPAKKISRQHTLSIYKNADYGISFLYPKGYILNKDNQTTETDQTELDRAGLGPVEMNFALPGGTMLASVQLPNGTYPGTDFSSGFFAVAVNSKLTAKDCGQFAFEDAKHTATHIADDDMASTEPAKMKLGTAEFAEVESTGGEAAQHADAKYYHVFKNEACYEFALGLETSDGKTNAKPVDHNAVFGKLNRMLSTVKIAAAVPTKTASDPAATPAVAAPDATNPPTTKASPAAPATTSAAVEGGKN